MSNANTTNAELATTQDNNVPAMLQGMAERFGIAPGDVWRTLHATIAPGTTQEELMAFCVVVNQYKLNPFLKEIYAFSGKKGGITPIVGIDGWLKLINTHPMFDGMDVNMKEDGTECTASIWRKDTSHPTIITEYLEECIRDTDQWKKYPRRMLRHKAIIQTGRVAFGFGGIYDEEEGADVAGMQKNANPPKKETPPEINPFRDVPALDEKPPLEPEVLPKLEEEEQSGDFFADLDTPKQETMQANREDY